ncbi:DUF7524 family protein [Methanococcoides alaskense]|uniref:Uncharacterized protein n=1 Tax=Methanococcoides alaskense TaxID=325778 RepID=A0AA90TYK4_9EURY|nr:hypothetical protein [Methanococcoides alaskense]MDA0525145.1 hypothetical protein [Methanococcoides alaskense]MDR6221934.1 hypothetical protein [Methanococcoides alaskense]
MQQVHINRLGVNSIEFETDILDIPLSPGGEQSFEIVIINYGSPTHVHLSASDDLYDNLTFLEDNPYVSHEEYIPVIARIPYDGRLVNKGKVAVTVGYGSKTESFSVSIGGSGSGDGLAPIDIDESLSLPSKAIPVQRKNDLNMQFSDRFSTLLSSFDQSINIKHIIVVLSSIVIVALIYMLILSLPSGDTSYSIDIGFYPAVALSILFTSLMAYLFIKLPALKK